MLGTMKPELPSIRIGTLAERLRASAAVPLEQALAGVRAHGPQPTQPNPSLAALQHYRNSTRNDSLSAPPVSSIETAQSTMPSLIPQRAG